MTLLNMNDYAIIFNNDEILTRKTNQEIIITLQEIYQKNYLISNNFHLGTLNNLNLHAIELVSTLRTDGTFCWTPVRAILENMSQDLILRITKAKQLLHWNKISQYCGLCGSSTKLSSFETAKVCTKCENVHYPSGTPAIIVLITRKNEILLGRSRRFTKGVYSAIAGFISPAETAEQAVIREVKEEVGLQIEDITYFGSQPWPFPNSFMLAYYARYASGELTIDSNELEDAQWFNIKNLPQLPYRSSIARKLIDYVIEQEKF